MIISKTPLRCSFFGGGTDFKDYYKTSKYGYGTVLSTAIGAYTYFMVGRRFDDQIRICYRIQEMVHSVDEIEHNIVREAMRIAGVEKGVDVVYSADIPITGAGVGLASSSSFAVGILNALFAFQGKHVPPNELAKLACEIEIDRLRHPIGIQDQYAVAHGGFKQYKFFSNGDVTAQEVICDKKYRDQLQKRLLLFYTDITRVSGTILKEQRKNISGRIQILDSMVKMTEHAYDLLCDGELDQWGALLDEGWTQKRKMASRISNEKIDRIYERAKTAGASGGKILGAGGGGFLLLYVPEEHQQSVRETMQSYREVPFYFEPDGSRIIFAE